MLIKLCVSLIIDLLSLISWIVYFEFGLLVILLLNQHQACCIQVDPPHTTALGTSEKTAVLEKRR